jgi:hypothetical protein
MKRWMCRLVAVFNRDDGPLPPPTMYNAVSCAECWYLTQPTANAIDYFLGPRLPGPRR